MVGSSILTTLRNVRRSLVRRGLASAGARKSGTTTSEVLPTTTPGEKPVVRDLRRTYDRLRASPKASTEFSVDRSGLLGGGEEFESDLRLLENSKTKEKLSALGRDLLSYIKLRGPITVHDYMAQASNHAVHGYYQHAGEKIGKGGDFVTAPEISQLFGEMIGIWCLSTWKSLGEPRELNLIELGPGKGTLMKDILRVGSKFPAFKSALNIHLVELSETMRALQRESLSCSKATAGDRLDDLSDPSKEKTAAVVHTNAQGFRISWHHMLQQVPQKDGVPTLVVGQEFLDAFPVHQFVYTKNGWREKLVDIDTTEASPYFLRQVLSPSATPAVRALMMKGVDIPSFEPSRHNPSVAGATTFPPSDAPVDKRGHIPEELKENDGIEICPLALATCEDVAKRIVKNRGAALFIDYGENFTQDDSLRGFLKHKQVNILSEPGLVDITADVDFLACAKSARRYGATVLPTIGQGEFLQRMGIVGRVEKLIEAETTTEAQAENIVACLRSLIDDKEMGKRFKVLGFTDPSLPPLVGFPQT